MNIAQAKEQIKYAMTAYFSKDEFGAYRIPIEKQRPVFLIGPPGIGKTAIMEQIADELGVGLVSYSMTHHTRQSALGLPFISTQEFDGNTYELSEYTMSEIIGSVYKLMKETGIREGILFLDEINCVSETLAPCMLQFLQYKVFGQHRVPDGWIIVTAGNPPEYNKSVRDFDIVTWDRLKRINVEPDFKVWKTYASKKGIHPAVMTYLSARQKDFYHVENTVDGKNFVTARGWDDLSEMIDLFEAYQMPVNESLISQYLQSRKIAKDFAIYYDLFQKYQSDYRVPHILDGTVHDTIIVRARHAPSDERIALIGLLFDAIAARCREICETEIFFEQLLPLLRLLKETASVEETLSLLIDQQEDLLEKGKRSSTLSQQKIRTFHRIITTLESYRRLDFVPIQNLYQQSLLNFQAQTQQVQKELDNIFTFCERAFGSGDEILLLVTELTAQYHCARFIGHYGNEKYYLHNRELQFATRQQEIDKRIHDLDLSL